MITKGDLPIRHLGGKEGEDLVNSNSGSCME